MKLALFNRFFGGPYSFKNTHLGLQTLASLPVWLKNKLTVNWVWINTTLVKIGA